MPVTLLADALARRSVGIAKQVFDPHPEGHVRCRRLEAPMVHLVELIDWAQGGPAPLALGWAVREG